MDKNTKMSLHWKIYWFFMRFQLPVRVTFIIWTAIILFSFPSILNSLNFFKAFIIYIAGIFIYCGPVYFICRRNKLKYLKYKENYLRKQLKWLDPERYQRDLSKEFMLNNETTKAVMDFDNLNGHDFEYFCAALLRHNGFENVIVTQGSGDHGIDITAVKNDISYAIQCKCYSGKVGNSAIQQAHTGKSLYQKDIAAVLTNNYFTEQAISEATQLGVKLWDRAYLLNLLRNSNTNLNQSIYESKTVALGLYKDIGLYVIRHNTYSTREISSALGYNLQEVNNVIKALINHGVIQISESESSVFFIAMNENDFLNSIHNPNYK